MFALCAQTHAPPLPLSKILELHLAAVGAMHLREPKSLEIVGTLVGLDSIGTFHEWQDGDKVRRDEQLGATTQRVLQIGAKMWVLDPSGKSREITGIGARRRITEDFIASEAFAKHPEDDTLAGTATLPDGRAVYRIVVAPPGGETYTVSIDADNWLVDRISYIENDHEQSQTYSDYQIADGTLVPYLQVDSNGVASLDVTTHVSKVVVDKPIPAEIFAPLEGQSVQLASPQTVKVQLEYNMLFTTVEMKGKSFNFLIDTGSQADILDPRAAAALGLRPTGTLDVNGAARVASQGVALAPDMKLGGVTLPAHQVTVLDLSTILGPALPVDGVLGYPFFAIAEVRIDADAGTMIVGKPGSLPPDGERVSVDTDRELPEIDGMVDGVATRLLVDTGNTNELLLFKHFLDEHPGLVSIAGMGSVANHGIGGSTAAFAAIVDQLQVGTQKLYNRYANVVLAKSGAFADAADGGNVGLGSLRNFVVTFDLGDHAMFLQRARNFDDGRYRDVPRP